jgi:hypothetical protein
MKTCALVLGAFLTSLLLAQSAFPDTHPDTSALVNPPIERDTLKKDPESRCRKIWTQMQGQNDGPGTPTIIKDENGGYHLVDDKDDRNTPQNVLAHIDDYRKMFWDTYPDKKYHEEAREAFAQALFLKDIHYLQSDLVMKNYLENTPSRDADLHQDTPQNAAGQALGQALSGASMDASINPDGGITRTALLQYKAWVDSTRKNLGLIKDLRTNAQLASLFKTDFGILGADYRKACDFGGKEYQAYVMERDWAEFAAKNVVPAGFDNKQHYGEFIYYRFDDRSIEDAFRSYADLATACGRNLLEDAAEKIMNAPKTSTGTLVTHVPEPVKLNPNGTKMPDYDMPIPPGVIGVYSNPALALEILVTQDDDYRYLLYILKQKYLVNRIPFNEQSEWAFSANAAQALFKAFGKDDVLAAAHLVRTATKRLIRGTIMDQRAIGAARNIPIEAFEDILSGKSPKGYILTALMFSANPESPASVDVDAAWKKLLETTNEKTLLDDAARMVLDKPNLASRNELQFINRSLGSNVPLDKPAPTATVDDPDFLAWKKFPDTVKVSYVIRGWNQQPLNSGHFTTPANPSIRYTLSVKYRTPEQIVLWNSEITYNYPSRVGTPPHDTEIGYNATRPVASMRGLVPTRAGVNPRSARTAEPGNGDAIDSGDETLNVAGRAIATHWTATTRKQGTTDNGGIAYTTISKTWSSDEIPGGLVRKTEETIRTSSLRSADFYQLKETVLESFQGFTPGTPAPAGSVPPAPPPAPEGVAAPAASAIPVPPAPSAATPVLPTPAPTAARRPSRERPTPAETAAQKVIMKRYMDATLRYTQLSPQLQGQRQRNAADAPALPPEITKARTDLEAELPASITALRARDNDEANRQLQSAEGNLTILEKYAKP